MYCTTLFFDLQLKQVKNHLLFLSSISVLTLSSIPAGAPEWMNITIQVAGWGVCGLGLFFIVAVRVC